jgi:hypothetical protein
MRFMHLANHGGKNIGNAVLVPGLERVLREDLPFDVRAAAGGSVPPCRRP